MREGDNPLLYFQITFLTFFTPFSFDSPLGSENSFSIFDARIVISEFRFGTRISLRHPNFASAPEFRFGTRISLREHEVLFAPLRFAQED